MAEQIFSKIISFGSEENPQLQIETTILTDTWTALSSATVTVSGASRLVILALNKTEEGSSCGVFVYTLGSGEISVSSNTLSGYLVLPSSLEKSVSVEGNCVTFLGNWVDVTDREPSNLYQPVTLTVKVDAGSFEVGEPVFLDKTDYNSTLINKIQYINNSDYFIFENKTNTSDKAAAASQDFLAEAGIPKNLDNDFGFRFGQKIETQVFFQDHDWKTAFGIFNSSTKSGDKADVSLSGVYIPTDKTTFIPGKVYYSDRDGVLTLDKYNFSTDITETTDANSKYTTTLTVSNYLRIGTAIATDKLLLNIGIEKSETISVSDSGGGILVPAEA